MKYLFLIPLFALMMFGMSNAFANHVIDDGTQPYTQIILDINGISAGGLFYNGTVGINNVQADLDFISLNFDLDAPHDGFLVIGMERGLFDSKFNGEDDEFIVLADGNEIEFAEIRTTTVRILEMELSANTEQLEIIGSSFINLIELPVSEEELIVTVEEGAEVPGVGKTINIKVSGAQGATEIYIMDGNREIIDNILFPGSDGREINFPWLIPKDLPNETIIIDVMDSFNYVQVQYPVPFTPYEFSIGAKSYIDNVIIGQPSPVNITFFNLETRDAQEYVDYTIAILNSSGEIIFNLPMMHTSTGIVNTSLVFPEFDSYTIVVDVVGILFQPIPAETFFFEVPYPAPAAVPKLTDKSILDMQENIVSWQSKIVTLTDEINVIERTFEFYQNDTTKLVILEEKLADKLALLAIFTELFQTLNDLVYAYS